MVSRSWLLGAALATLCAVPAHAQGRDAHFLDSQNEYFVANQAYESGWLYVTLARMLQPASDATRGEAQFIAIGPGPERQAGQRFWSRFYWQTRVARPDDVIVGKEIFCVELTDGAGTHRRPANRTEAIQTQWWMGTITDTGDLYKQEAMMGDFRVNINCLRVAK